MEKRVTDTLQPLLEAAKQIGYGEVRPQQATIVKLFLLGRDFLVSLSTRGAANRTVLLLLFACCI